MVENNGQLNLRFDPAFIERLEREAQRFELRGKNVAAQDTINTYYANWVAMQRRLKAVKAEELKKAA